MLNPPKHLRQNFERTDDVLCDLEGLLSALEIALDAHPTLIEAHPASSAIFTVFKLLKRCADDLRTTRRQEWVGLGGSAHGLTDDQRAEAEGKA